MFSIKTSQIQLISQVIDTHKVIIPNDSDYSFKDPEEEINKVIKKEKTQEDIINYHISNNLESIKVNLKKVYDFEYHIIENKIKIKPLNPDSAHIIRLVGLKKISKSFVDLDLTIELKFFPDILSQIYKLTTDEKNKITDYCTVCGNQYSVIRSFNKISCCDNLDCKIKLKHIVIDNNITEFYQKDPVLCGFLINILIVGTTHPKGEKIFKPIPVINGIGDLEQLKNLLKNEISKSNLSINTIAESKNDIELIRKIGSNSYAIINNAISDNFFSMSTINNFSTEVLGGGIKRLNTDSESTNPFDSDKIKFIGFNYSYEIENTFKKENFLFHGTSLHSWYPIIKNGLKVMSGTEFQVNGAVYGNGVYFSDSFSMSLSYSSRQTSSFYPESNTNSKTDTYKVVGVFEINDSVEKFKKTQGIYVVNDDKIMLLRYLIIINSDFSGDLQQISDYFVKYLGSINKSNEKKSFNIKNKRLGAELKMLGSNSNVLGVDIIDETKYWEINLKDLKQKKIKLNVYFVDYPKLPPKIILDSNINKKVLCSNDNSILLDELNPSKWEVTNNLSKVVNKIYAYIEKSI